MLTHHLSIALAMGLLTVFNSSCSTAEKDVQPVTRAIRPAVPVTVDVAQLPDGEHTVYAKDGDRLIAQIKEKAITSLRITDTFDQNVPIHTVKRLTRDGKSYAVEDSERMATRASGGIGIAPPMVPGDCGLIYAGPDTWWLCATDATISAIPPPPPADTAHVNVK
jgi:hypothetical protein